MAAKSAADGSRRILALKGDNQIPAECCPRGREAEDDAGEYGEREREAEDAQVEMNLRAARKLKGGLGADAAESNPCEQHAQRSADDGEQRALGEELAEQTNASCTERRAHSKLPGACCGASQQQTGHVGADNQQQQAHSACQQQQRCPNIGNYGLLQRLCHRPASDHIRLSVEHGRMRCCILMVERGQLSARLFHGDIRLQPSEDVQVWAERTRLHRHRRPLERPGDPHIQSSVL